MLFAPEIGGDWDAEAFDPDAVNQALTNWKPNQNSFMYAGFAGD